MRFRATMVFAHSCEAIKATPTVHVKAASKISQSLPQKDKGTRGSISISQLSTLSFSEGCVSFPALFYPIGFPILSWNFVCLALAAASQLLSTCRPTKWSNTTTRLPGLGNWAPKSSWGGVSEKKTGVLTFGQYFLSQRGLSSICEIATLRLRQMTTGVERRHFSMARMMEHTKPDLPVAIPCEYMVERALSIPRLHLQCPIPSAGFE